jgi:hypothetical protein
MAVFIQIVIFVVFSAQKPLDIFFRVANFKINRYSNFAKKQQP